MADLLTLRMDVVSHLQTWRRAEREFDVHPTVVNELVSSTAYLRLWKVCIEAAHEPLNERDVLRWLDGQDWIDGEIRPMPLIDPEGFQRCFSLLSEPRPAAPDPRARLRRQLRFWRRVTVFCAVACLTFLVTVLLTACDSGQPLMSLNAQWERSEGVRVCTDGTLIGRDPVNGQYLFQTNGGFLTAQRGRLAPGVTPDIFCSSRH